jgi:hypothetical protein
VCLVINAGDSSDRLAHTATEIMKQPHKVWIAAVIACALGGVLFTHTNAIAQQLDQWDVLPKPEPFTSFYFNDYTQLPTTVDPHTPHAAAMTVHNLEHMPITYHYTIDATPVAGESHLLKEGTCTIGHNKTCTIDEHIAIPPLGPRIQIRTTLTYQGRAYDQARPTTQTQSVHYWVDMTLPAERVSS